MTPEDGAARGAIDAMFVVIDGVLVEEAPVLQSQVGDQLLALRRAGIRAGLLTTTRDPKRFDREVGDELRAAGVEIALVPHRRRLANILAAAGALRRLLRNTHVRKCYARGIWGPLAIRLASPSLPYVYDARGTVADETLAAGSRAARAKAGVYAPIERWCVRRANRVTAVSQPFASELLRTCGRDDVVVIPSCIDLGDASRFDSDAPRVRAELGFSPEDIVLVYSGSVGQYQALSQMLELWESLAHTEKVRFLLLTNTSAGQSTDPLDASPLLRERVVQRSVARGDVARYLAACDAGFILREPRLMNRVASPVKFAEYLAAGIAVVASPDIGDMSSLIAERRIGVLVDGAPEAQASTVREFLAELRGDRGRIRRGTRALAATRYSWDAYASVHQNLYDVTPVTTQR
ncbi:MAG: glycosyltransferase [Gemmatimonadaceae bacterium]